MKALILALGIWLCGFALSLLGLVVFDGDDTQTAGEVVLEQAPLCGLVVVRTDRGWSFLDVADGSPTPALGDRVTGRLRSPGLQTVSFGDVRAAARIDPADPDPVRLGQAFQERCGLGRVDPDATSALPEPTVETR